MDVPTGDALCSHLTDDHDDPPDGSWGEEEWAEGHLYHHQQAEQPHFHEGMVLFPYPEEQLEDHVRMTHLMHPAGDSQGVVDWLGYHEHLHLDQPSQGVSHEHRADGTHLVEVGARVGDPLPKPIHVIDPGLEFPEIDPLDRRLVLLAAGELSGAIEAQRKLSTAQADLQMLQRSCERHQTRLAQHLRALTQLGIHPKMAMALLPEDDQMYLAQDKGEELALPLYEVVESLVHQRAAHALAADVALAEQMMHPEDDQSPGSRGTDGDTGT